MILCNLKTNIKLAAPEFIFSIYFWSFAYLRLIPSYNTLSTTLLFANTFFWLTTLFIFNYNRLLKINTKIFLFSAVIITYLILNLSFRFNSYQAEILYKFLYSCIVPIIILSIVFNPKELIRYFSYFSVISILLFSLDQLKAEPLLGDYMAYGYNFALPASLGTFLGYKLFNNRWMLLFFIIQFILSFIFANRGVTLSIVLFILLFQIIKIVREKKSFLNIIVLATIAILLWINIARILEYADKLLIHYDIRSYSLSHYVNLMKGGNLLSDEFSSGRFTTWETVINIVENNLTIGLGFGEFSYKYNYNTHNIIFDVLLDGGILWFLFIIAWLLIRIRRTIIDIKYSRDIMWVTILFFFLAFPKLLLSQYYITDLGFISFMSFLSFSKKKKSL